MEGGGYGFFSSRTFFSDNTKVRIFFFPEFNIRLYDKNYESDYFFFLHQNQNIFFSKIGNQNIFFEKNHNPPLFKLNGRSLIRTTHGQTEIDMQYGGLRISFTCVTTSCTNDNLASLTHRTNQSLVKGLWDEAPLVHKCVTQVL